MRILTGTALLAAAVFVGFIGAPVAGAQTACQDLGGVLEPDQTCRVHAEGPTYQLDFTFPNGYPDPAPVVAYLTQARDGFVNVAGMPDSYNLPYELDATGTSYRSGPPTAGTRSLVFTVWQNIGGAHPQTYYQSFNWNVAKNAPITFETLFKPGSDPLDVIYPEVNRYLQNEYGTTDPIPSGSGHDPTNYEHFAVTDDELIFFFTQGSLLPESAGPVQASVPRAAVAPMLAL
ncbi:esterase [Mycolicibacterium holsaticum]|uniref:DUF3298 domain-containing protein n=1 Tax=Mycolicibacterium holsaticum TaxID=152142 RepID=A0A1E3RXM0_9MYCO|nr:esterase [Mycolicibacterium holsaticum]MDA4110389.1 hypothetical protein [Mycolicibacterium holsaticum DSM 44478 = JCM 12374]ODQ94172.1 hypothetical protein BHQ17_10235 [Mycolicibacterium holsaticum]QZA11033.1 RsiV family protein [Mycolicibacterium holsaticum DSM 44478 = JCM 12374]UNC11472.1 DUF3298 domain-containing protein [Mycolicibacterium holsaticum DSM 44478 = JCM 12374]